ncbi:MAG: hypothetical protein ABI234_06760, partial [Ktedonobacteraceae bacterium]
MVKLMKVLTIALGLILSLGLFTSGAFAQSVTQSNQSVPISTAVGTHANIQQMNSRRGPGRRVGFNRVNVNRVGF